MAFLAELESLAAREGAGAEPGARQRDAEPDWPAGPPETGEVPIGETRLRRHALVVGTVVRSEPCAWQGGTVLEADIDDATGRLTLAFLGRTGLAGLSVGAVVRAEGTVGLRQGRRLMLNPVITLRASDVH